MARRHIRHKKKEMMKKALATLAFLLLVSLGLFFMHRWETRDAAEVQPGYSGQQETGYFVYNGQKYAPKSVDTVLLIGIDKFASEVSYDSYNNQQQADFLLLLVMDDEAKTCTPLHVNRDTMVDVPVLSLTGEVIGTTEQQIALAHTYGSGKQDSCENTVQAFSNLLWNEVNVQHYISTTMDAVQTINDMVGGVTVMVEDDFSAIDDTLVQGQQVKLMGRHALTFVRSRSGMEDSSNLARMERQRQYLAGLRSGIIEEVNNDAMFAFDALGQVNDYIVSDCTVNQLAEIANDVVNYEMKPIRQIEGSAIRGEEFIEYHVDEEALTALLVDLFYKPVE